MKKSSYFVSLAVLVTALSAYSESLLAEVKIGFVDTVKLIESAPQAKSAQSEIEAEFAPREKELVAMQREIGAMEEKLGRDGAVMSDSERTKHERQITAKRREMKRSQDEFRDDLNIRKNEVLAKLQKDMYQAVVELAKEQSFDLILSQGVVYSSKEVDITDSVINKLSGSK
ncbi:MAG: OmpH family outer membrane protein [Gammaproteobacteria bacterium]